MTDPSAERTTTLEPETAAAIAARTTRNSRAVAASVIALGLAVAGLLLWKAATNDPSEPSSRTPVTTSVNDGPTG